VLRPWNVEALPEIMAGAVEERKRCVPERSSKAEQEASNRETLPEREGVECGSQSEA